MEEMLSEEMLSEEEFMEAMVDYILELKAQGENVDVLYDGKGKAVAFSGIKLKSPPLGQNPIHN